MYYKRVARVKPFRRVGIVYKKRSLGNRTHLRVRETCTNPWRNVEDLKVVGGGLIGRNLPQGDNLKDLHLGALGVDRKQYCIDVDSFRGGRKQSAVMLPQSASLTSFFWNTPRTQIMYFYITPSKWSTKTILLHSTHPLHTGL